MSDQLPPSPSWTPASAPVTPVATAPSRTPWVAAVALLAVFSLAAGSVATVQTARMRDTRARAEQAEAEVAELEKRVTELEDQVAAGGVGGNAGGLGGLEDLFGGLLGEGGLGDLFGPDGLSGLEDLLGEGGLDGLLGGDAGGLLDGLLGEGGLGDLGSLLGGADQAALQACLAPGTNDGEQMPEQIAAALDLITTRVEEDRALDFAADVPVDFLDGGALQDRVETLTAEDYTPEDAALDARVLEALGAIAPGTDLRETLIGLYGDQVAGFYDPDTGELVVGTEGSADPSTQVFLAHELVHALTDERIGLPDQDALTSDDDASLAAIALVEGDATLLMQRYTATYLSLAEQLSMAAGAGSAGLDGVPAYLASSLTFPYVEGLNWVCNTWLDGGWDAVDAAYASPPTTTLEILDPVTHAGAVARDIGEVNSPGDDWTQVDETTFGAAELLFLFQAPGDDPERALEDARGAALAWRGGRIATWDRDGETAVSIALEGADASLCEAVFQWYSRAFDDDTNGQPIGPGSAPWTSFTGGNQTADLMCTDTRVTLGIAPTLADARRAAGRTSPS